ncbi:MAG: FAD-binding oxidoreductase, partial [Chitinophagaceae bacterium]
MRNHSLYDLLPAERVLDRLIDRVSYAADAGFYYLLPRAVVQPMNEQEIQGLFQYSQQHRIPLVFRAGGTSLSGQSITDGILVDLSKYWNTIKIEEEGQLVRVQPGLIGAQVNQQLKKWNRKIGPDPSSLSAARMGGILSNNASGMCCGVKDNSYHTLAEVRFILPNGKLYATEAPNDRRRFEQECPELHQGLLSIRERILATPDLLKKITEKYQVKNTVGYSLNAFVDHADPLDIFAHLLIGGEGTLAFISEAVLKTVPEYPCKSTSLLLFPDISAACEAIEPLTQSGARMIELMDRASLRVMEASKSITALSFTLPDQAAALLVEFQENEAARLHQNVNAFLQKVAELSLLRAPVFTEEAKEQEVLWKLRKGLFPSVGAVRARGTTVILEDLCFPVERLGAAIQDLQQLFQKYQYEQAILFGHAKDGNIHFVITQSFREENEVARYDRFIRDVVSLVVEKYQGSLKAEHGTGRNMAPFVETEWGGEAYAIMRSIKQWVD